MILSISLILVSAIVLGAMHFFLIGGYVKSVRTNMMLHSAEQINNLTAELTNNFNPATERFYKLNIDLIAQSLQSYIVVTDTNGKIVSSSKSARNFLTSNSINISDFTEVINGKSLTKTGVYNALFNEHILTVATPLKKDDTVYGIVFLNAPLPELSKDAYSLLFLLLISVAVSSVLGFFLSLFLSKNISNPIKELSKAARLIAKGEFRKRVKISDVEELKELGTAFNSMARSLENHENVRTSFIANVSHDLRTPMTTISGFVQGILDGTIPRERENEYLGIVLGETKRLSNLVSGFLDVSRYEAGEVELHKTSFDINEMIRVVLISLENIILQKNLNINITLETENWYVCADEVAIHRVIANLLDNATKFADADGELEVIVKHNDDKTIISISNTGSGISDEDKKYIWDRFYKTDKARTVDKQGMGLGLYIVKSIINQHGEKIELQNDENFTKFTFTLQSDKN